jgi:regulator of sigma E protease
VILAGVTMNWVFAFLAFSVLALRMGVQEPIIVDIVPDTPADEIGLELGDKFLSIDGVTVRNPGQVSMVTEGQAGEEIDVVVEREGERIVFRATPAPVRLYSEFQKDTITVGRLGVSIGGDEAYRTVGAAGAVRQGWNDTVYWTEAILRFLKRLVTGRTSVRELGGPIMIGQISGEAARTGFWSLLSFMAIISINLAVLNLLPIPVLDGGHMVFIVVEALRGKAVSIEQRVRWSTAGMVVVMGIMIWAIGNDLLRVFGL